MLEVEGEGRRIFMRSDGCVEVDYGSRIGQFEYEDLDDFAKDLEMFMEFGRAAGILATQHVVVL